MATYNMLEQVALDVSFNSDFIFAMTTMLNSLSSLQGLAFGAIPWVMIVPSSLHELAANFDEVIRLHRDDAMTDVINPNSRPIAKCLTPTHNLSMSVVCIR
jgi:hypothetical protein